MIEVKVSSIRVSLMNQHRVVLLKDLNAERYLPIWIGPFEAEAINLELQNARKIKRPMTHDLLKNVIEHLGGKVVHILINDMRREVFYARIVIDREGEQLEVDARPSDALALAVRVKAPIFIDETVLDRHGVEPEDEVDLDAIEEDVFPSAFTSRALETPKDKEKEEEEIVVDENQFSAFSDFVNSLDLDLEDSDDDD